MARVSRRVQAALDQAASTHALARTHETAYKALVLAALGEVARQFTDLIAAAKPVDPAEVAHLKTLWGRQTPALAAASADIYQSAGNRIGKAAGGSITTQLRDQYLRDSANRLADVGDDLWGEASGSLADGALAGEGYDKLTARLVDLFSQNNAMIGESRATRIARTEVQSSVNMGSLDAMTQSDAPPGYKIWTATIDSRTRDDHFEADGQCVPLTEPFMIGGDELDAPGDPSAPEDQTIQCRCCCIYVDEPMELPLEGRQSKSADEIASIVDKFAERGVTRSPGLLASAGPHTGGMIALVPSEDDAARLALADGEPADDLHVTLAYLGDDITGIDDATLLALRNGVADQAATLSPVDAEAFAVSWFNPDGDSPCWVLGISGDGMEEAHGGSAAAISGAEAVSGWVCAEQHPVWVPHLTLQYSDDPSMVDVLAQRVGPVRFDRLRLALAGDNQDFPLTGSTVQPEQGADVTDTEIEAAATMAPEVVFTTARIRALTLLDVSAFEEAQVTLDGPPDADGFAPFSGVATLEGTPTGDGREYDPGSFRWEDGSQPFEWAAEFGSHDGAVCVGRVDSYTRDGNLIRTSGVVDTTIPMGQTAYHLMDRGLLKWVSVVMDDIPEESVEYPEDDMPADPIQDAPPLALTAPLTFPAGTSLADIQLATTALVASIVAASASDDTDLPIAPEGTDWAPDTAHDNITAVATDADGDIDPAILAAGHLWFVEGSDPGNPDAYQLPFADAIEGVLQAIPAGLDWASAAAIAANQAGTIPDADLTTVNDRLAVYYERLAADDDTMNGGPPPEIEASAWTEFRQMPSLSPELFAEPELALEGEWFHYDNASGRIFGWVAQANICHDAFSNACVTAPLGEVDLAHFNRQPIELSDGTTVMAGAFTMAAGHQNDGADAQTMTALFDDTRTVAGIVTVGVKADGSGMWFSGLAAPWLSDWDTQVLAACRPSGHWRRTAAGGYSLRAVLSVPVPGFPNKVAASAVVERSNLTLVASAAISADPQPVDNWGVQNAADPEQFGLARLVASMVVDMIEERDRIRAEVAALSESLNDERRLVAAAMSAD